jgi:hypothetical protein
MHKIVPCSWMIIKQWCKMDYKDTFIVMYTNLLLTLLLIAWQSSYMNLCWHFALCVVPTSVLLQGECMILRDTQETSLHKKAVAATNKWQFHSSWNSQLYFFFFDVEEGVLGPEFHLLFVDWDIIIKCNCMVITFNHLNDIPTISLGLSFSWIGHESECANKNSFGTTLVNRWAAPKDNKPENAFLVIGRGDAMKERFGDIMQPMPIDLSKLSPIKSDPNPN